MRSPFTTEGEEKPPTAIIMQQNRLPWKPVSVSNQWLEIGASSTNQRPRGGVASRLSCRLLPFPLYLPTVALFVAYLHAY